MPDYTIQETPVSVVKQKLMCSCGREMTHTGVVLTSLPAQYPHKCGAGHMTVPPHPHMAYPSINFVDIASIERFEDVSLKGGND